MELVEALKKAEIFLVEGENKVGKLTFSLFILSKLKRENILIISAINKSIIKKRLDNLKNNIKNYDLQEILKKIKLYALKSNWEQLKISYGFDIFLEDFNRLVNDKAPDTLILHRSDLMFSEVEFEYAKIFVDNLISLKEAFNFKLFLTTEEDSLISEFCENYTDITFLIQKDVASRKVIIKNSIFPLEHYEFKFYLKDFVLTSDIETADTTASPSVIKSNPKMVVISPNEKFIKLHKYLFENYFDLSLVTTIEQIITQILQNPDIIVYHTKEKNPNKEICKAVKDNKLNSKIIYFVNREFIRTEERREISFWGCYEIMPIIFNLEEYIFVVEKAAENFFYTQKIHRLPSFLDIKSEEEFNKIMDNLIKERIYFLVIKTTDNVEDIKDKLRIYDFIFKKENFSCIILINITKDFFEARLKNKFNLKNYEIIEAIEWNENKDFCK